MDLAERFAHRRIWLMLPSESEVFDATNIAREGIAWLGY
jgi:hypothetical protein